MSTPHTQASRAIDYDVVIVGFGPSGAVAACWLGLAGIRTLVIDKSRTIWQIPRAIAIDHEILRVFQNLGVADQVLEYTAPFPASEHFGASGQLIRRIDAVSPPWPMGYVPTMVFTQPPVEAILRTHAAAQPSVTVALGVEMTSLAQDPGSTTLQLTHDDGATQTVTTSWVIACDGAASRVRQAVGIGLDDLGFDEPWMVIDINVNEASLSKLPATAAQYCNPARPATFIIGPGNHRRWEIMLLPGEDPRAMESPENVWRLLAPWLTPADGTLWRASSYRFHALIANEWRKGRVFIAGDAAHQQPPFIGQGMCQGIRDVTNLTWKLRAVLSGNADQSLLDTYFEERSRHVFTLTSRIKAIGRDICELDPEAARKRDEALILKGGGTAATVTRQEIVPPITSGLLCRVPHAANGTLFPQPWIVYAGVVAHMDDVIGHGWRVVFDGRHIAVAALPDLQITPAIIGVHGLQEQDGIVARWFDRNGCRAVLVRPDHYVYGTFNSVEDTATELTSLFETLRAGTSRAAP